MAEPFRDGVEAAIERAERLAEENEDLRDEVLELRHAREQAQEAPPGPGPAPDPLADATLDHLAELTKEREESGTKPEATIAGDLAAALRAPHAEELPRETVSHAVLGEDTAARSKARHADALPSGPVPLPFPDAAASERASAAFRSGLWIGLIVGALLASIAFLIARG